VVSIISLVLILFVGCSSSITDNEGSFATCNVDLRPIKISGNYITSDELSHFISMIQEIREITSQDEILQIVKSKLNESNMTRSQSLYLTALEFVTSNWHLTESGLRTPEQLFAKSIIEW